MRLVADPHSASQACLECGGERPASSERFCCERCRKAFNNRAAVYGAPLFHLLMELRFNRGAATHLKLWRAMNRLAGEYRRADLTHRAGRPSWLPAAEVLERRPSLLSETLSGAPGGRLSIEKETSDA